MYMKFSPLHKTCRAGEAGAYTEKSTCWEEEADKKKIMELKCSAFAMVKKQTADQTANKQIMKKGGSESDESYVNRISATICGQCVGKGCKLLAKKKEEDSDEEDGEQPQGEEEKKCGYEPYTCGCGFNCKFQKAKDACNAATHDWKMQHGKCTDADHQYREKRAECDSLQDQMDDSACKRAVITKDACEAYEECYFDKKKAYHSLEKMVKQEETDRKAEWKGLNRMKCLIKAFADKKVKGDDIDKCKKMVTNTDLLIIKYPALPPLRTCTVPDLYPNTPHYKKVNFAPLPALAKGKEDSFECAGLKEISTTPAKGSPPECKCKRVTMNGPYSPGPVVKCVHCLDIRRSLDKNSCPDGTKLFAPRTKTDWKTFFNSAAALRAPNFIIDITKPSNHCHNCNRHAMNSKDPHQMRMGWVTGDKSSWWLRDTKFKEPTGDYQANCFLDILSHGDENAITFNDAGCNYHAQSYYCQAKNMDLAPKEGSPAGCVCKNVALTGKYSPGALIRCTGCLKVSRSTQKNSCPVGTKIFSPRTRQDWRTFIASATPLRSPNWIIDVTQPQNGCGGCTRNAMNSRDPAQATWRTTDSTAWFLRTTKFAEPDGDYYANCYLDLQNIANENSVTFKDGKCDYHSNGYYCQPAKLKKVPTTTPPPPEEEEPPQPEAGKTYEGLRCAGKPYTGLNATCDHFTNLTEQQCWAKCQNSSSAMDDQHCDAITGLPECVANVYHKKLKICMLYRTCTKLKEWPEHPDIVTRIKPNYDPSHEEYEKKHGEKCEGKPYATKGSGDVKKCIQMCRISAVIKKGKPQKRCVAFDYDGTKGICEFYDKCEKLEKSEKKGLHTFKFFPRLAVEEKDGGEDKEEKEESKGDDEEEEE